MKPEMPALDWGGYLVQYLWDAGPTLPTGMGPAPLTWSELRAWQDQTGVMLAPWEVQLVRRLSCEFASESQQATRPDRPAPYTESSDGRRLKAIRVARDLDTFLN